MPPSLSVLETPPGVAGELSAEDRVVDERVAVAAPGPAGADFPPPDFELDELAGGSGAVAPPDPPPPPEPLPPVAVGGASEY